jgi:hypothetical protein
METPLPKTAATIDAIVTQTITDAMRRIIPAVQRHVARIAAEQLEAALDLREATAPAARRGAGTRARGRRSRQDLTRWVADRNARRVPNFVIEMTGGLDTKTRIVAKFGENATFEKEKPLPPAKRAA